MLARFQGITGDGTVADIGGKDVDHVNAVVLDEILIIGTKFGAGSTEFFTGPDRPFFDDVTKINDLHFILKQGQCGEVFLAGDAATTYNPCP
jgi:hypothetical protein